jgi:hypothetical protein
VSAPRHARDPRLDEGYRTSRAVGTVLVAWVAVLVLLLGGIAFATVVHAAPLAAHGHVNVAGGAR